MSSTVQSLLLTARDVLAQRDLKRALAISDEAIRLGADPLDFAYVRWMCFMMSGNFARAWEETDRTEEARCGISQTGVARYMRRVWNSSSLENKRVLVRCYHGLGDTIQFIRYIPMLKKRATQVVVQSQEALVPLLSSILKREEIICLDNDAEPRFDCEIELMELAYAFRTTLKTIPRVVPYLQIPNGIAEDPKIMCDRTEVRIGLCWSSGGWNRNRDISLADLLPITAAPGFEFFSLQGGHAIAQTESCEANLTFRNGKYFSGTVVQAALTILNLDLIISVDTMIAHLAGALGKPVWMLLPFCADWRWMVERDDSPWYPTMRLFRQASPRNWNPVIERVICELQKFRASTR